MGGVSGLLGTAGGASGTGYNAPAQAAITPGTNANQISTSYGNAQNSLQSQQALLAALQSQNGLSQQNQALGAQQGLATQLGQTGSVGAQTGALAQQQALNSQLAGANGVGNLSGALTSQQALAQQQQGTLGQYQAIANGQGPNPALAQLNQTTGQNVANQAALMAGQRGASSNVGLIARQAAQQGAATQQAAVGQGASLEAQLQLNALSGLTAQQQAIGNTNTNVANIAAQQVAQQQAGTTAAQSAASNLTAQTAAQQAAAAGQANTIAGQQIAGTGANTSANLAEQSAILGANAAQNSAAVGSQGSVNSGNTTLANTNQQGLQGIIGGLANSAGGALSSLAEGGEVKKPKMVQKFADGTPDATTQPIPAIAAPSLPPVTAAAPAAAPAATAQQGPQSGFGQFLHNWGQNQQDQNDDQGGAFNMAANNNPGAQALQKGFGSIGPGAAKAVKNHSSSITNPTGISDSTLPAAGDPALLALAAKGGMMNKKDFTSGGNVKATNPKEKAVKTGNSYDNDKIPAMLSEGEVVIPRNIMQSEDPVRAAGEFVAKVLAKRKA